MIGKEIKILRQLAIELRGDVQKPGRINKSRKDEKLKQAKAVDWALKALSKIAQKGDGVSGEKTSIFDDQEWRDKL